MALKWLNEWVAMWRNMRDFLNFGFLWSSLCWRIHGQCVWSQGCSGEARVTWPSTTEPVLDRACFTVTASTSKVTQPLSRSVKDKPHQAICTGDAFSVALSAKEAQKQFWAAGQPDNIQRSAGTPLPVLTTLWFPCWGVNSKGGDCSPPWTFGSSQEQLNMLLTHHQGQ